MSEMVDSGVKLEALLLRMPADVKRGLRERARAARRSMNAQAIVELQSMERAQHDAAAS